jgi:hypothetical protein
MMIIIFWHDTWKLEQIIARQRLRKHIPVEANAGNNRRLVFSVVHAELVVMQRWGKYVYAAVNQDAMIEEAVFCAGGRLYKRISDSRGVGLSRNLGLEVAAENWAKSPELAVGRIIEQKLQEKN